MLFLILFLFYIGYMVLWVVIEDNDIVVDLISVLCFVGFVFVFMLCYVVNFWNNGLY